MNINQDCYFSTMSWFSDIIYVVYAFIIMIILTKNKRKGSALSKKINVPLMILMVLSAQLTAMELAIRCKQEMVPYFLIDPVQALYVINSVKAKFYAAIDTEDLEKELNIPKLTSRLEELFDEYDKQSPLFMFDECTVESEYGNEQNASPCLFSRKCNLYRQNFEECISRKLAEKKIAHQHLQVPVNYTSFGCGGAFSDLITITKVLLQEPDAHLIIHLIDGTHLPYTGAADYLNVSREITVDQKVLNFGDTLNVYAQHVKNKEQLPDSVSEVESHIVYTSFLVQKQYQQMIRWLTKTFPESKLSLFIHSLTESYFDYLDVHNLPHADVVSAADIQDWMSLMRRGVISYVTLCIKTLEKKPDSCNVWLAKDPHDKVTIDFISANKTDGARTINLNDYCVYATAEDL
jgi:hypothetical protein